MVFAWKNRIAFLLTIVILIALLSVYYLNSNSNKKDVITEIEGLPVAERIAHSWNPNATLFVIRKGGDMVDEGRFSSWIYTFCESDYVANGVRYIEIRVFSNKTGQIIDESVIYSGTPPFLYPIEYWNITSEKAYGIALNNKKIKEFLSKYDPYVSAFSLRVDKYTKKATWGILWSDMGFLDNPHSAEIQIDATTGEVLYVEADLSDGSSYLICLVPLVIIISILLVILLFKSKRFTTFAATGFALFLLPALFLHIYHYSAIFTIMALVFGAVLWKGLEKYMGRDFLKSGDKEVVYGLFGLLAADYFGLIIARFLSISYSYPDLLWSSFIIINVAVLYMILSLTSEKDDSEGMLKPFKN